ncbi:uncharacterized protein At1g76070-like [Magnolia sinica]|uniref:uncharacterized protein At1g76070-like n=1 Tax=Magnolia sinica TaxID=86752 RepID=UPI002658B0DE|nr:uncharacterized protein At1g76070-like [Magnolia sinica]
MEKPSIPKSSLLSFLSKNGGVCFSHHPYSPGLDKRIDNSNKPRPKSGKGYHNPIGSIFPAEIRRKLNNIGSFGTKEPVSPKVSCIGQIKHNKKSCKAHCVFPSRQLKKPTPPVTASKIYGGAKKVEDIVVDTRHAPNLTQMKRFSNGRDAFANVSWKVEGVEDCWEYSSDEEKEGSSGKNEFVIPNSAPVVMETRNEVNLWKRRSMAPPTPLQMNGFRKYM